MNDSFGSPLRSGMIRSMRYSAGEKRSARYWGPRDPFIRFVQIGSRILGVLIAVCILTLLIAHGVHHG